MTQLIPQNGPGPIRVPGRQAPKPNPSPIPLQR
jgi:hypothetical protein